VVTYNRRQLLAGCLAALRAQSVRPDRIVVVDNGSTDGTAEWLEEQADVEHLRLEENRGSTGGFAAGIDAALAAGCEWIWLMDDDAEPAPDALEQLLPGTLDTSTAVLCPAVVSPDGSVDVKHRGDFRGRPRYLPIERYASGARLGFFTWVGPLVRAGAARAAGLPKAELFMWADDYEYSLRMREHGEIRLVPESRVVHRERRYENRRSRFWNRLTGWDLDPTPLEAFWRNLCGIRNYIWLKRRYEHQTALSAAGTTAQFMVKALLYDERPLRRLPWIARAARDGRRGTFGTITPERWGPTGNRAPRARPGAATPGASAREGRSGSGRGSRRART
jgi:rhamnopyranosyl-N-acetylglucosaminyl-diphospho-decaprenol beta-1,3/1,4-galactofuranosyltransferase